MGTTSVPATMDGRRTISGPEPNQWTTVQSTEKYSGGCTSPARRLPSIPAKDRRASKTLVASSSQSPRGIKKRSTSPTATAALDHQGGRQCGAPRRAAPHVVACPDTRTTSAVASPTVRPVTAITVENATDLRVVAEGRGSSAACTAIAAADQGNRGALRADGAPVCHQHP